MSDDNRGAADFFGADLEKHIQDSEGAFEEQAVRQVLKKFGIDPKGWDVQLKMGERYRFPIFDEVYPGFPIRLGTRRLVARRLAADKRSKSDLAFHELKPLQLFRTEEFRKTQVYREWRALKEDQSADRRDVGLVFQSIGSRFIIHNWSAHYPALDSRLEISTEDETLFVELLDPFLKAVWDSGWRP